MTESNQSEHTSEKSVEFVRDSSFARFVADEGLVFGIGRDLEVAFIQYGPALLNQTQIDDHEVVESRSALTEVARMRISYPAMMNFVMQFLRQAIVDGKIKGDKVAESIAEWAAAAAEANAGGDQ